MGTGRALFEHLFYLRAGEGDGGEGVLKWERLDHFATRDLTRWDIRSDATGIREGEVDRATF